MMTAWGAVKGWPHVPVRPSSCCRRAKALGFHATVPKRKKKTKKRESWRGHGKPGAGEEKTASRWARQAKGDPHSPPRTKKATRSSQPAPGKKLSTRTPRRERRRGALGNESHSRGKGKNKGGENIARKKAAVNTKGNKKRHSPRGHITPNRVLVAVREKGREINRKDSRNR